MHQDVGIDDLFIYLAMQIMEVCNFGGRVASLLSQEPHRVSCPTPPHDVLRLIVNGMSSSGPTVGRAGYFYPLYLNRFVAAYHAHTFAEHPGRTFYMPDWLFSSL